MCVQLGCQYELPWKLRYASPTQVACEIKGILITATGPEIMAASRALFSVDHLIYYDLVDLKGLLADV